MVFRTNVIITSRRSWDAEGAEAKFGVKVEEEEKGDNFGSNSNSITTPSQTQTSTSNLEPASSYLSERNVCRD